MTSLGRYQALGASFKMRAGGKLAAILRESCVDLRLPDPGVGPDAVHTTEPEHLLEVVHRGPWRWSVRWDGRVRVDRVGASDALYDALTAITNLARSTAVPTYTVLDAGAVEIDGVAVGFVGPGGARKSAFTASAALNGCAYIADDVLAIDDTGRVRPFHRPVSLRHRGIEALGLDVPRGPYSSCYPLRLGGRTQLSCGAPLGLLVLVDRNGTTSTDPLPEPLALVRLGNQTLAATGHERTMFQRLDQLVRWVPVITITYADLGDSLSTVRGVLDRLRR